VRLPPEQSPRAAGRRAVPQISSLRLDGEDEEDIEDDSESDDEGGIERIILSLTMGRRQRLGAATFDIFTEKMLLLEDALAEGGRLRCEREFTGQRVRNPEMATEEESDRDGEIDSTPDQEKDLVERSEWPRDPTKAKQSTDVDSTYACQSWSKFDQI
jgi:hypothetical protein